MSRAAGLAAALVLSVAGCSDDDRPPAALDAVGCPSGLECTVLEVPQVHAAPGGPTLGLRIYTARSPSPKPGAAPLVYLEGGPGGSVQARAEGGFAQGAAAAYGRDVVLIEQRGNSVSRPALDCGATNDDYDDKTLASCTAKYSSSGVHIEAFNTVENAHDVDDLRRSLGVPQVILWGSSYGGELAQTVARLHPDAVAALLLESAAMSGRPYRPFEQERAQPIKLGAFLTWLDTACAASARCAAEMPGLNAATELAQFGEHVMAEPLHLTEESVIDSLELARTVLVLSMYFIPSAVLYVRMMHAVNTGQLDAFAARTTIGGLPVLKFIEQTVAFAGVNRSSYTIYDCYDTVRNWTDDGLAQATANLYTAGEQQMDYDRAIAAERQACAALPAPSVPQSELAVTTTTDIPTIFFHGGLDWPTPIENVIDARAGYTRSQLVTASCAGHGIRSVAPSCFDSIASTFFAQSDAKSFDPGHPIDDACVAAQCDVGTATSHDENLYVELRYP